MLKKVTTTTMMTKVTENRFDRLPKQMTTCTWSFTCKSAGNKRFFRNYTLCVFNLLTRCKTKSWLLVYD